MNEKSTSTLERDAERVRADIADTADHLKAKMSPGQLMDEVVDYFKEGDVNQLVANLKHQVRDNPLALALVGGGLAWLMMGSGPGHANPGPRAGAVPPRTGQGVSMAPPSSAAAAGTGPHMDRPRGDTARGSQGSAIGDSAARAKGAAASAAHRVGDAAASATATAGDAMGSASDAVSRSLHDLGEGVGEQVASAAHAGADMGERVKSSFLEAIEREPLVVGALGLAVGAAIGAMVPVTRPEQDAFGQTAQDLRKEAKSAMSGGVEKAKDIAGEAYGAARDEADRQGLMPGEKPVAGKVADVAAAAGSKTKESVHRAVDDAERSVDRKTDGYKPTPGRG